MRTTTTIFSRAVSVTGLCMAALAGAVAAQEFTAADSGWVRLFNGTNFDGLYSRTYGATAPLVRPPAAPYQILYAGTDTAAIRVTTTTSSQQGNIGTDKTSYKHYRVRVQYRFDVQNGNNNAGLTYHTDETAPRMQNNWPRSIESQMKQSETGSAFSIQQVAFTTRTNGTGAGSGYSASGNNVVQACEFGCNGRWYRGNPLVGTHPAWNQKEVVVRGSDSALHIINGNTVMRLWDIRLVNNSGQTISPIDSGGITLQAEGSLINYRRWEVMEMPPSTPMSAHYLHRLLLDWDEPRFVTPGMTHSISWKSIGEIPKVKIEYRYTSPEGNWVTIADSAPNTGSFNWAVPREAEGLPKAASVVYTAMMRISSSLDYVQADSSQFDVVWGTSINPQVLQGSLSFGIQGGRQILPGLSPGTHVEIRNVAGSRIRVLTLGDQSAVWDRRDERGNSVPAGLYFARALSGGIQYRTGRMLVD